MSEVSIPHRHDTADETSPLLPQSSTLLPGDNSAPSKPWILVVALLAIVIATTDLGSLLALPPRTRIYESIVCFHYYERADPSKIQSNGTVLEELCKVNAVQDTVAMLFGWQDLWDAIPGIFLAVPYGALADKYGRRWILTLCIVGAECSLLWIMFVCYFQLPLKLTWLSSAFMIIGGGPAVAGAIIFTMVSDIVPAEKRTIVFFYVTASVLVAELIAPALSSILMKSGLWSPLVLGAVTEGFSILISLFIPETLHLRNAKPLESSEVEEQRSMDMASQRSSKQQGHGFAAQMHRLRYTLQFLKRDISLTLVILTFLVNRLGRQSMDLLLRYSSKRYHWSVQKAALLLSVRAGLNMISFLVLLPALSMIMLRWLSISPQRTDLLIARGSVIFTILGFVVIGLSPAPVLLIGGLVLYTFGTGFVAAMRSVAIFMVGGQTSHDIARLFAMIAIMEAIGMLLSGPLLSLAFRLGMKLGDAWLGMPFLLCGMLFALIMVVTFTVSLRDLSITRTEDEVITSADVTRPPPSATEEHLVPVHSP